MLVAVQRSLLALEWLLLSELTSHDHIAVISSQTLVSLYTSDSMNPAVQQKARKVAKCRSLINEVELSEFLCAL